MSIRWPFSRHVEAAVTANENACQPAPVSKPSAPDILPYLDGVAQASLDARCRLRRAFSMVRKVEARAREEALRTVGLRTLLNKLRPYIEQLRQADTSSGTHDLRDSVQECAAQGGLTLQAAAGAARAMDALKKLESEMAALRQQAAMIALAATVESARGGHSDGLMTLAGKARDFSCAAEQTRSVFMKNLNDAHRHALTCEARAMTLDEHCSQLNTSFMHHEQALHSRSAALMALTEGAGHSLEAACACANAFVSLHEDAEGALREEAPATHVIEQTMRALSELDQAVVRVLGTLHPTFEVWPLALTVRIASSERVFDARTRSIGRVGAFVLSTEPMIPYLGERISLTLFGLGTDLPDAERTVTARIVSAKEDGFEVRFLSPSPAVFKALEERAKRQGSSMQGSNQVVHARIA